MSNLNTTNDEQTNYSIPTPGDGRCGLHAIYLTMQHHGLTTLGFDDFWRKCNIDPEDYEWKSDLELYEISTKIDVNLYLIDHGQKVLNYVNNKAKDTISIEFSNDHYQGYTLQDPRSEYIDSRGYVFIEIDPEIVALERLRDSSKSKRQIIFRDEEYENELAYNSDPLAELHDHVEEKHYYGDTCPIIKPIYNKILDNGEIVETFVNIFEYEKYERLHPKPLSVTLNEGDKDIYDIYYRKTSEEAIRKEKRFHEYIDKYSSLNLIPFSSKCLVDEKNEKHYKYRYQWNKVTGPTYSKGDNIVCLLTGELPNHMAIDIDDMEECKEYIEMNDDCEFIQRTWSGKLHYHYQYDPDLANGNYKIFDVKTQTKSGSLNQITVAPSFVRAGSELKEYVHQGESYKLNKISEERKAWLLNKIKQFKGNHCQGTYRQVGKISQKYIDLLKVAQGMNASYETRMMVIFAFVNKLGKDDEVFNVLNEWNKVEHPNANERELRSQWNNAKVDPKDNASNKKVTIASVIDWCKRNNKDEYNKWIKKYMSLKLLVYNFDQTEAAKYFHDLLPHNYVYKNNMWYILQKNNVWKQSSVGLIDDINDMLKGELHKLRDHYLDKLSTLNRDLSNEKNIKSETDKLLYKKKDYEGMIQLIKKICHSIGTVNTQKAIVDSLCGKYWDKLDKIQFDSKWYLLGFENNVYDLINHEFRPYKADDYMTDENVGYDYREPSKEEYNRLSDIIRQIQPNDEERKCLLSILATGLEGRTLENFIVFNGRGGNGKGLLDELMIKTLGKYGYNLNSACLCTPLLKEGANPELANLHKKRFVVANEPSSGGRFNNAIIKKLTGGCELNARKCHSNDTATQLKLTLVCECNNKPGFREDITNADVRRIIDLFYPAKFTFNDAEVDHNKNIYKADKFYKTDDFKNQYKYAMMKILLETYKSTKGDVYIPESVRKRSIEYLTFSHWALQWFKDNYVKLEKPSDSDFVQIQTLWNELKETDAFTNLNRTEKRNFTKNYLIGLFSENELYGCDYLKDYRKQTSGSRIQTTNIMFGYGKIKPNSSCSVVEVLSCIPNQ